MNFNSVRKVAFIGNHTPRQCGIATFTADVSQAVAGAGVRTEIVAVNDTPEGYAYPQHVTFQIEQDDPQSYKQAAEYLNSQQLDLVCVQHEYGIFGGPAGSHILMLLRALNAPIVTTLHTILQEPNDDQRAVLAELAQFSERFIVMSRKGKELLEQVNGIDPSRISIIHHGVPSSERLKPEPFLKKQGLEGKKLILTFGLLSPSKGIETMIKAMPQIVQNHPEAHYIVLGATHPNIRKHSGETYRQSLIDLCAELGVSENVQFVDRFASMEDLTDFLHAASIYVTPYLNKAQITSGTLARAFASGKAVVSTPYWHAEELLAGGLGVIVPFKDPEAMAHEIDNLLSDPIQLEFVQARAFEEGQKMAWPVIGREYVATFEEAVKSSKSLLPGNSNPRELEERFESQQGPFDLTHLKTMTDDTGIFQHATYTVPNRFEGYCVDDNARLALVGALLEQDPINAEYGVKLQHLGLSFMSHALNPENGRMRNFLGYDRTWFEVAGSEDSHGRSLWALGALTDLSSIPGVRNAAKDLFMRAMPAVSEFTSPRSYAFTILGLANVLASGFCRECLRLLDDLSERLNNCYLQSSDTCWRWFEPILAYDNARLAQALLTGGHMLGNDEMIVHAKDALTWLTHHQTDRHGCFLPIGSDGFFPRNGARARYDQQPLEAAATIDACCEAYRITGDPSWRHEVHRAFAWFHGANSELKTLIDETTGGCRDGLKEGGVNLNQGAESTLAYISSALQITQLELDVVTGRRFRFLA